MKVLGEQSAPKLVNLQPVGSMPQGSIIPLAPAEKPDAPC